MSSVQPTKPMISTLIALILLGCFAFIDPGPSGFLQSYFYFDTPGATAVKFTAIIFVGIVWLLVQIFMPAPTDASHLSLAVSGSILWLGLTLFYHFADPAYGGTVAFFALVGGLEVVVIWTRYLADEF